MATALLGVAKPLVGSVLGGLFGGRKQAQNVNTKTHKRTVMRERTVQEGTQASQGQSSLESLFKNMMMPVEDPLMAEFRRSLLPLMAEEYSRIQKPVYGEGEIAKQLQQIGGQYSNASDLIMNKLAGAGALSSGRTSQLLTDIALGRAGAQAGFLSGLPLQEEQLRRSGLNQIFSLMTGLTGRAPIGQVGGGSQQRTGEISSTTAARNVSATRNASEEWGQNQQTTTGNAGGFWPNFAGNVAKGLGMGEFDPVFNSLSNLMFNRPSNSEEVLL